MRLSWLREGEKRELKIREAKTAMRRRAKEIF